MNSKKEYPGLHGLLAGPFFQCWYEFDERLPDEILKDAVCESTTNEIQMAIQDIEKIFNILDSAIDLQEILGVKIGCNYNPEEDGLSRIEWLLGVKVILEGKLKDQGT